MSKQQEFDRRRYSSISLRPNRIFLFCFLFLLALSTGAAAQCGGKADEDEELIDPTRPTILESATVPRPGTLQIEYGIASFSGRNSDGARSSPLGLRFAPNKCLRLDFDMDVFTSEREPGMRRMTGIGDSGLAVKYIFRTEPKKRLAFAVSYGVKLPSASREKNLGTGRVDHVVNFIFQRTYGKNDFVFNAAYLNNGREDTSGRLSGAQTVLAYGREVSKKFSFTQEAYAQTLDAPGGARGIYTQSVFAYKIDKRLRFDTGIRFGFGQDAPRFGLVGGLVVGIGDGFGKK